MFLMYMMDYFWIELSSLSGATKLTITTFSLTTLTITTISIMTISVTFKYSGALSIMTLRIMILNTVMLNVFAECHLC
jgi:hypothetical protein